MTLGRPRRGSLGRASAGVTLLEVMVATTVLAMIAVMIYSAFDHTGRMRTKLSARQQQDHVARIALGRLTSDLRMAFLSAHVNPSPSLLAVLTGFVARDQGTGDRVDFSAFSHRRLRRSAHEGDACEVGYRVEDRRGGSGRDLMRRESPRIDNDTQRGGTVDVLVPNVSAFELRYYDSTIDQWIDSWDTTQATGQFNRLPSRVRATLRMRETDGTERSYTTATPLMITEVLRFGLPLDYR